MSTQPESNALPTATAPEIIFGGRQVSVVTVGGADAVTVRTLRISELPTYFEVMEDDEKLAAFLTGKDAAYVASLAPASVLDICEAGHELNFQIAQRWAARRVANVEALAPALKTIAATGLPNSAPIAR